MPRIILPIIATFIFLAGLFFLFQKQNNFQVAYLPNNPETADLPGITKEALAKNITESNLDIENQKPLENPPKVIKAAYATSWSAGSSSKISYLIKLIKETELNAIVIDVKDYSGVVTYDIKVPEVAQYGAREVRIPKINSLIKKLHDDNIYVIGRVTVFQDPIFGKAKAGTAIKNSSTGAVWKDNKGISWIDPSSMEAWDYNISIAKDAANRGFDEINFDYIRFPSDGNLSVAEYPFSDLKTDSKSKLIRRFFQYLRENTSGMKISADLFGLATINSDDLGIGQVIEHAYENFDYVSPMVYPSHFAPGSFNYKNPAEYPYDIVKKSITSAFQRLISFENKRFTTTTDASASGAANLSSKLRPWLQNFDLGAVYDRTKIQAQIKAVKDAYCEAVNPSQIKAAAEEILENCDETLMDEIYGGWMLWDPKNNYTPAALEPQKF